MLETVGLWAGLSSFLRRSSLQLRCPRTHSQEKALPRALGRGAPCGWGSTRPSFGRPEHRGVPGSRQRRARRGLVLPTPTHFPRSEAPPPPWAQPEPVARGPWPVARGPWLAAAQGTPRCSRPGCREASSRNPLAAPGGAGPAGAPSGRLRSRSRCGDMTGDMRALLCLWLVAQVAQVALSSRVRTRRELSPGLYQHGVYDAGGSYCQRGDVCCHGRDDGCTVPYHDTLCYCDLFCNRTVSDCCPDFWEYCLGIPAPFPKAAGCSRGGRNYPTGATYRENCNLCTCGPGGQWQCEDHACLMDGELIDAVNRGNFGWRAANYSQFWGMTLEDGIRHRLGTFRPSPTVMNMNEMHMNMDTNEVLPRHFDAAAKWPGMIHEPLDQGNCAGSWAFSTAAVASDRISIHSMGHMTPALSPQNLLSCDTRNQRGCSGGRLDGAWWYLRRRGVVTDECYPFTSQQSQPAAPPCMMHSRSTGRGKRQATARCPNPQTHSNEIYQSTPAYRLSSSEKEIMKELLENGPVQAILEVHEDFFMYKSGIYRHTPVAEGKGPKHQRHGTHSVKITGWGEEQLPDGQTQKYWTAANSWGTAWGEGGHFRIARGVNECEVETFVVGVWGRVSMEDMPHK
ncbi:tubulointerstitial nephritis antigen-like isoform X1 [Oenanthe melanoleuca]|uniref:tubulointerstitial nephritis antigen-like isoform X1 n=2 Tax=Oenanthe melanoleuca TaxID=2939378 RepID=UPI0024C1480C|nr:tubulointerstitial nephritis antigen-like isoform X1 [Oenanthe melanoleuca]